MANKMVPDGYKETKVGVIPVDWEVNQIEDTLQRVRKKVEVNKSEKYRQIGIRSHTKGIFHKEEVTGEALGNKAVFWIEEDCFIVNIVFAWEQAVAKTTVKEKGMIASHRFPMYKPKNNKSDIDYILYFFKSKRGKYLLGLASPGGAGRNKTLGQNEFSKLQIPLPPLKEQEKISKILSTWDKAISKQEQLIKAKEELKKGLMQKLLSGEVRFKEFQDKWQEVKLGKLFDNVGGTSLESLVSKESYYKFISIGNYSTNGKYIDNGQRIALNDKTKTKLLSKNNLVMVLNDKTASGDLIGATILINENNSYIYNQRSERLICKDTIIPLFAWFYINSKIFRKKVFAISQGGTQIYVNFPSIKKLQIVLPSLKEQQKITEVLSFTNKDIELLKNELENLKTQKKGLMQKLLLGQVRVRI